MLKCNSNNCQYYDLTLLRLRTLLRVRLRLRLRVTETPQKQIICTHKKSAIQTVCGFWDKITKSGLSLRVRVSEWINISVIE